MRSRVHEYGGASTLVSGDLIVVSDFVSGRLHRVVRPAELVTITPERQWRYADAIHDAARNRLIAIREDHEPDVVARHGEWVNDLVAIDLDSGEVTVLAAGSDFYSAPRLSPDGTTLVWVEWHHPNLPWDGTELRLRHVRTGWRARRAAHDRRQPARLDKPAALVARRHPALRRRADRLDEPVSPCRRPHRGRSPTSRPKFVPPDWPFGQAHYGFLPDGRLIATARSDGRDSLIRIGRGGEITPIDTPYTEIGSISVDGDRFVVRAAGPTSPAVVAEIDLQGNIEVLRHATPILPEPRRHRHPAAHRVPDDGQSGSARQLLPAHESLVRGAGGRAPPLIVTSHGGPTGSAFTAFQTGIQLFASRGYAVLDVDYGGSTGYGREYRERLVGEWGIVDVDDCVAGAKYLAEQGLVDGERQAIRGGSASGFTTLAALAFTKQFDAGCTYFGIGDLRAFVKDTHKFESRYLESLVGPWPAAKQLYLDRSPALHADQITSPVLVQQGEEDMVVPKEEGERIVDALFERRVPHAYLLYPGEDHGFRSREAITRSFGAELSFYAQVFGFEPADDVEPVEIQFLEESRSRADAGDGADPLT